MSSREQEAGGRSLVLTTAIVIPTLALALCLGCVGVASAAFGIVPGSLQANQYGPGGEVDTRAAVHPFAAVNAFDFNTGEYEGPPRPGVVGPVPFPEERVRDIVVDTAPGLVGDPTATPTCSRALFFQSAAAGVVCPPSTQVGVARLSWQLVTGLPPAESAFPIFNLPPGKGEVAAFGIFVVSVPVVLKATLDPATNAVEISSLNTNQAAVLFGQQVSFWGVPADSSHDSERVCMESVGEKIQGHADCEYGLSLTPRPFLSSPTSCEGPQPTHVAISSWERPDRVLNYTYLPTEGGSDCDGVPFAPAVKVTPTVHAAGSPTGLSVDIHLPQTTDADSLATSHLRDARVTLPEGMSLSPSSADGLGSCSDAEIGFGTEAPLQCPDSARIGAVDVTTPALPDGLSGAIYLRPQASSDPESGEMLRLAMVIGSEDRGVLLKLPGQVRANARTGQLEAAFEEGPQLPFEDLHVRFKDGPRAALVNPSICGTYTAHAELTSWARPNEAVSSDSSFKIDQNCLASSQFNPGFEAGATNPTAGEASPFTLRISRNDAEQNISRIEATLPEGVLATLAGVPLCGDSQAAMGNCPEASKVGSTTVRVGAGSNPLYVPQPGKAPTAVYLAGPYKGAPYSLIVKVPAQAGPFDLGTVTVRNAISIDPETAQVSVKSDPLPQILQGIPIAYRDIRVNVDRPEFTLNPTSCDPKKVKGTIGTSAGKSATVSDRFQVANCERLGFKPKLQLTVKGPTHRSAHPRLKAVLTMPQGGANIRRAQVTLPKTEFLENAHIRTICTRVQYAAQGGGGAACPKAAIYGHAKAWTPLLDKPLQGPVYLRSSSNPLPDLVASLDGQIHVDLVGRIDSKNARLRNTFEAVPDAPVSKFVLEMQGGRKGLLVNNTELCKATPRAEAKFDGQNGKIADSRPVMKADCGKKKRGKRK